jgi:hypothetical protein
MPDDSQQLLEAMTRRREERRARAQKTANELNDTSPECLAALDEIRILNLEDENAKLRDDKARLDWLLRNQSLVEPTNVAGGVLHIFTGPKHSPLYGRKAIDAGMARIP